MAQLDKERWLARLLAAQAEPAALRLGLLDLFFAAGQGVREQAVALSCGDALCLSTAPTARPCGDVVVIDLQPPQLPGQPTTTWPPGWRGLGGPAALAALVGALAHAAANAGQLRVRYVRVPALGAADYLAELLAPVADNLCVVQPVDTAMAVASQLWGVVATAARPRNIWRFAACDFGLTLQATAPEGTTLAALLAWLATLPPGVATTIHDLVVKPHGDGRETLRLAVRSSAALEPPASSLAIQWQTASLGAEQRLLFPVGDVLAQLHPHPGPAGEWLGDALLRPRAAWTLPDGMTLLAMLDRAPSQTAGDALADTTRTAGLRWAWEVAQLAGTRLDPQRKQAEISVAAGVPPHATCVAARWSGDVSRAALLDIALAAARASAALG